MEITAAATTPVVAASRAPTRITAMATPPRTGPKTWPTVSSRSSAMPDRSRMMPMKVKKGMASKVSFCMMPKMRKGSAWNMAAGKMPASMPTKPKARPTAARPKATGKPVSSTAKRPMNMSGTNCCAKKVVCIYLSPASRRAVLASSSSRCFCSSDLLSSLFRTSGPSPLRKATRLTISDRACSSSRAKPRGIRT